MHALAVVSSSQFGEPERIRHVTPRRLAWLALLAYALLALALFSSTWVDPVGSWIGSPKDPKLFIWYLGWMPHELARGHNPLFTDYLAYPDGVNLMWNTSMIFPALVLWPATAVFGPVVAYKDHRFLLDRFCGATTFEPEDTRRQPNGSVLKAWHDIPPELQAASPTGRGTI